MSEQERNDLAVVFALALERASANPDMQLKKNLCAMVLNMEVKLESELKKVQDHKDPKEEPKKTK